MHGLWHAHELLGFRDPADPISSGFASCCWSTASHEAQSEPSEKAPQLQSWFLYKCHCTLFLHWMCKSGRHPRGTSSKRTSLTTKTAGCRPGIFCSARQRKLWIRLLQAGLLTALLSCHGTRSSFAGARDDRKRKSRDHKDDSGKKKKKKKKKGKKDTSHWLALAFSSALIANVCVSSHRFLAQRICFFMCAL